jgi:hypothetical protein
VSPTNKVHVIANQEIVDDALAKAIAYASFIVLPIDGIVGWIGPEQIVEETIVRDVGWTLDALDVIHRVQRGRQTAMDTEYLGSNDCGYRQTVEYIDKGLPYLDVTATFALVIKAVHLSLV